MAIYSGSFSVSSPYVNYVINTNSICPIADVMTKSSTGRSSVLEFSLTMASSASSSSIATISIARSLNTPVQAGQVYLTAENYGDQASLSSVATAWSIAPTFSATTVFRRYPFLANISGSGILCTFPRGLNISSTNSIAIGFSGSSGAFNSWLNAGTAVTGSVVVNE